MGGVPFSVWTHVCFVRELPLPARIFVGGMVGGVEDTGDNILRELSVPAKLFVGGMADGG